MAEPSEGRDPQGEHRSAQPGGGTSRGPNPDPGGEEQPGGLVPPYDDRTTDADDSAQDRAASVKRQLSNVEAGADRSDSSPADEQPVSDDEVTDQVPDSPKGVGVSTTSRGEDMKDEVGTEPGRHDVGTDSAGRPIGVSDARDKTSVAPQEPDDGAPKQPEGEQGG